MIRSLTLSIATALAISTLPAAAQDMGGVVDVDLVPGWRTEEGTHMAGLRIRLAPGWKTYWRAPGEAGIPPTFDWRGSENVTGARVHWPAPEVMRSNGMRSLGYHDAVTLPVEFTMARAGAPARIEGRIDLGVCEKVCVPLEVEVSGELPAEGERAPEILAALVDKPLTADQAGVTGVACSLAPGRKGMRLTTRIEMPTRGGHEMVVVEPGAPGVWASGSRSRREGGTLVSETTLAPEDGGPLALDRSALRMTVLGEGGAVDIRGCSAG